MTDDQVAKIGPADLVAGYSGRPLAVKLGIKANQRIAVFNAPDHYQTLLAPLPAPLSWQTTLDQSLDLIHFFTTSAQELQACFPQLKAALVKNGSLWISWPKKAAKVATDLDDSRVRAIGLEHGLVDVKVAAIDQVWSGLKFVYRKSDR